MHNALISHSYAGLSPETRSDQAALLQESEYQDPMEFFRRTYLTEGLLGLLVTGIKRLTGHGGDPVVQLQTVFGGGKTHSMLVLYHLCGGTIALSDFPGGEKIAEQFGDSVLPQAKIAVLVGTALDPSCPRDYPEVTVHTLWGELAYQLGGVKGYELIEQADQKGVNPGSDTLSELLQWCDSSVIIIDELVAYARNLYGVERLPAGSFDSLMSFMQSLTEAVKRSKKSMLLISLPESDIEVGGEAGRIILEHLSHVVGRIESIWKPVTATESFEIVRRRLFATEIDYAARDAVVNAFGDMYRNASAEFPSGVPERDYWAAYPIHPELFHRLYDENDADSLRLAVRDFLAWQSIQKELEDLNLDAQQRRQVKAGLEKTDDTVRLRVQSVYNWLLVPIQPDPLGAIALQPSKISGDDNFYDRAARKLRNDGVLIDEWSPDILRMELDTYIWSEERGWDIRLKQLWEYLAQYCYFPRLFDHEVLLKAIKDGVNRTDAPFAYATGKHAQGYHSGIVFHQLSARYAGASEKSVVPLLWPGED